MQLELAEIYARRALEERPGEQWPSSQRDQLERDPLGLSRQREAGAASPPSAALRSSTV